MCQSRTRFTLSAIERSSRRGYRNLVGGRRRRLTFFGGRILLWIYFTTILLFLLENAYVFSPCCQQYRVMRNMVLGGVTMKGNNRFPPPSFWLCICVRDRFRVKRKILSLLIQYFIGHTVPFAYLTSPPLIKYRNLCNLTKFSPYPVL